MHLNLPHLTGNLYSPLVWFLITHHVSSTLVYPQVMPYFLSPYPGILAFSSVRNTELPSLPYIRRT